jgi:eukaryotic-like serine/threonine-protein kinase
MPLPSGTQVGPYKITGTLGAGGMGEVYRARDSRLERTVAIKILPQEISSNPESKQRFQREAKTISGLNHPNICVLYDVGTQDGMDYLVMELVEGQSLAERLEKGPLPLDQVLKYGAQIADALEKAHWAGIVHRDLKPGNLMLTATGAKLLDFGLAKEAAGIGNLATMTSARPVSPVTQEGTIVGTFQYMSPEQVEGKDVDGRSDIFSLGAVLYEMLTGKRAFEGKSQLSVASSILEREPEPISAVKPMTPRGLEHIIRKCLAKEPEKRWQSAGDIASELQWVGGSHQQAGSEAPAAPAGKKTSWLPWALSALLAAGLLAALMGMFRNQPAKQTEYFSAPFPFSAHSMAIAPNGHTVAVASDNEAGTKSVLWLYELGSREARSLPDTDGASFPFWSADGNSVGFFASGKLRKIEVGGRTVQTICDAPSGRGATWNKDGVILFTPSGRLGEVINQIPASGGTPAPLTKLDLTRKETSHRWPEFLPDGKHFLFMAFNVAGKAGTDAIFVGSLDSKEIKKLADATSNASYAAPGYLLFSRDKTLYAQKFDAEKLEVQGEPAPILTEVQYLPRIGHSVFSVNHEGVLLAQEGNAVELSRLVWFDRSGKEVGTVGNPEEFANVAISPDGRFVAVDKTDQGNQNTDIWIYDLQGTHARRFTFDPAIDAMPMWSPDGKWLAFSSSRQQFFDLYIKPADGSQDEKLVDATPDVDKYPHAWSPDGKYFLYLHYTELWTLSYPELKSQPFLKGNFAYRSGKFSPDGKWVAYSSNENGRWEVYVTSFPEAKGKWQISTGGGLQPRWRGDGKELFYLSLDGKLMAVPVNTGASFDAGAPVALFQANAKEPVATSEQNMYDVSKDDQRFLINTQMRGETQPMSVVMNWDAGIRK